jgi:hypothetical protein
MRRNGREGAVVAGRTCTPQSDVKFVSTCAMTRMILYFVIYMFEAACYPGLKILAETAVVSGPLYL